MRTTVALAAGAIGAVAFMRVETITEAATIALLLLLVRGVARLERQHERLFLRSFLGLGMEILELRAALDVPKRDSESRVVDVVAMQADTTAALYKVHAPHLADFIGEVTTLEAIAGFAWVCLR